MVRGRSINRGVKRQWQDLKGHIDLTLTIIIIEAMAALQITAATVIKYTVFTKDNQFKQEKGFPYMLMENLQ